MREWLVAVTEAAVPVIDMIALVVILVGTIEAVVLGIASFRSGSQEARRALWLRYARWLIGGLTFQLAADIIETSIRTDWESIARLGAVAATRTFLNFFLERDLGEVRERQRQPARPA